MTSIKDLTLSAVAKLQGQVEAALSFDSHWDSPCASCGHSRRHHFQPVDSILVTIRQRGDAWKRFADCYLNHPPECVVLREENDVASGFCSCQGWRESESDL